MFRFRFGEGNKESNFSFLLIRLELCWAWLGLIGYGLIEGKIADFMAKHYLS